jgi:hypothetical protein
MTCALRAFLWNRRQGEDRRCRGPGPAVRRSHDGKESVFSRWSHYSTPATGATIRRARSHRLRCGGDNHPGYYTICAFRTRNRKAFKEAFVKVLMLAQEMGHLKKVGGMAVDDTKVMAKASKHSAVSYSCAEEMVKQIEQFTCKA